MLLKAASGGAFKTFSTTKLISVDDALAAFRRAGELQHGPPRRVCIARGPYGHLRIWQVPIRAQINGYALRCLSADLGIWQYRSKAGVCGVPPQVRSLSVIGVGVTLGETCEQHSGSPTVLGSSCADSVKTAYARRALALFWP